MTTATLTNNSSRLATFVVFWSCVIVVGAGVQVMPHWFTKRLATSTEDLVQLGSISAESGYNRRRVSNDLSWIGLSEGDKVFSGDRIYTGDQSSVTLKLADGTKIRLRPRSLVQISLGRNGLYIDLSQGEVETEPK
jgi:ferric-dicitrate binding protein FerR (iron transport regulator)